ncbi:MAG: AMP-binding protein [Neisseria sp.]|nr:AMP-binding protein [Neisseria sp.]
MEKIWLKSYQPGVRAEVDVRAYDSIPAVFDEAVRKFGNRPGFTNVGVTQTYAETAAMVDAFASYLQNVLKLPRGERVAVMMPNVLQYPIAVFGILKAGYVVVNVNPLYTPRELAHQLKDSGARTILILENFANTLQMVLAETPIQNVIIANLGDLLGFVKGNLINFVLRKVKKVVPPYRIEHAIAFKSTLQQGKMHPLMPASLTPEDLAFLQYTGGTTGVAKGAELTHGNIIANMQQAAEWMKASIQDGEEVVVTPLPLYHIFSLTVNLMIFTRHGAKNILIANPRDTGMFIKMMKREKVTGMTGVNTLFNALVNHPEFAQLDFSTWKVVLGGGAAVQQAVADKWHKITGLPIVEAYGLTETSPGVCVNPLNITAYTGSIGLPLPNTDVEIRDDNRMPVPLGEAGELWVKGPQVMRGYWQRPEDTAKSMDEDGFFATGDVATMSADGYVKLIDRKKDMVIVSGFNVYPNEVEDVVSKIPGVLEAACIGVPNEKTGEALKLFVVKKDPNLTAEEIIAFCRQHLTAYKVPRDIEFRDELPKSNVGKILRKELRG